MVRARVVLLALLSVTAAGCGGDPGARLVSSGYVEATQVRVSSEIGGTLAELDIEEGDRVALGDVIGRLDTEDIDLALEAARSRRAQARAELRLLEAGARDEDVAEARALVDQAEASLAGADRHLGRMQALLDSGSGTESARDEALTRRNVAREALRASRERLRRLLNGSRPEEIDAARARMSAAEAEVAQLEERRRDALLRAPVAGRVTHTLAESGEVVGAGTPVAVLTDLDDVWLTAFVGEPRLGGLTLGQEIRVETDDGQVRRGTLRFIAEDAEFTPQNVQTREERVQLVFEIQVALPNEDRLFKPGMPAEAHLPEGKEAP
jgi:HlyD family secretion protein